MLRYVGSGDVAYVQFYFSGDYIQNFPDGYFKVSIAAQQTKTANKYLDNR